MLLGAGTLAFGGLIVSAWKWVVKKHHEGLEELGLIDNK